MSSSKLQLLSYCLLLTACSTFAPEPTVTPTATATNTPIPTATITHTPEPTATDTPVPPTDTPEPLTNALDTQGTPAAEWNGIPIMPDAVAGEGDNSGYFFRVNATPEEIFAFYDRQLGALGYSRFADGESENGTVLVFYQKDLEILTLSVIVQDDGSVIVLIV